MSGSYRDALTSHMMDHWEQPLREALNILQDITAKVWEASHDEDQYDNAADTGALASLLGLACHIIRRELPKEED